eukprot:m51a1_g5813 hypothetical protein (234) ;mRNA; f:164055-178086
MCITHKRSVDVKAIDISWPSKKQDKFYNGKYKGHVVKIQVVVNNQGIPMNVQGFPLLQQYRQAMTPAARQDYEDTVVQAFIIAISTLTRNRVIPTMKKSVQNWNQVIFTDKASFELFGTPRGAWQSRSHPYMVRKVKHPGKVHVWGCFSAEGFRCLYTFTCNLNSKKLCHIYNKALLPSTKKMFGPAPGLLIPAQQQDQIIKGWEAVRAKLKEKITTYKKEQVRVTNEMHKKH